MDKFTFIVLLIWAASISMACQDPGGINTGSQDSLAPPITTSTLVPIDTPTVVDEEPNPFALATSGQRPRMQSGDQPV